MTPPCQSTIADGAVGSIHILSGLCSTWSGNRNRLFQVCKNLTSFDKPVTTSQESNDRIGTSENAPRPGLCVILFKDLVHCFILLAFPSRVTLVDKLHHCGQVSVDVKQLKKVNFEFYRFTVPFASNASNSGIM